MVLLEQVRHELQAPVWINADILAGPGGKATPVNEGCQWADVYS